MDWIVIICNLGGIPDVIEEVHHTLGAMMAHIVDLKFYPSERPAQDWEELEPLLREHSKVDLIIAGCALGADEETLKLLQEVANEKKYPSTFVLFACNSFIEIDMRIKARSFSLAPYRTVAPQELLSSSVHASNLIHQCLVAQRIPASQVLEPDRGNAPVPSTAQSPVVGSIEFISKLTTLPSEQFDTVVMGLEVPAGLISSAQTEQRIRAIDLVKWARREENCGLPKLQDVLEQIIDFYSNQRKGDYSMHPIVNSVVAKGIYDIIKKGVQSLDKQSKLYEYLKERQWKRLYQDGELMNAIERYSTERSHNALVGIDAALQNIFQKDTDLASSFKEILTSEAALREILTSEAALREVLTSEAAENTRGTTFPQAKRMDLILQLSNLPPGEFEIVRYTLNCPTRILPEGVSQAQRAGALLTWGERQDDCDLPQVQRIIEGLIKS